MSHHYYASTAYGWSRADTRAEAIAKVARQAGSSAFTAPKGKPKPTLFVWTCKVNAPKDAAYSIEFYMPTGVDIGAAMEFEIVSAKGHVVPRD